MRAGFQFHSSAHVGKRTGTVTRTPRPSKGRSGKNGSIARSTKYAVTNLSAAVKLDQLEAQLRQARSDANEARLTVLALAAHCDDEGIGPGGTLATLAGMPGSAVYVAILAADNSVRRAESLRACELMGIPKEHVFLFDFPDGGLINEMENVRRVLRQFAESLQPDLVFSHKPDMHPDHCLLFTLVRQVFARGGVSILHFRIPQPAGSPWNPRVYVRISERAGRLKLNGLFQAYPTENWKDYFDPVMNEGLMIEAGHAAGCKYAEAFEPTELWLTTCPCGCGSLILAQADSQSNPGNAPLANTSNGKPRIQVAQDVVRVVLEPCQCACGSIALARQAPRFADAQSPGDIIGVKP